MCALVSLLDRGKPPECTLRDVDKVRGIDPPRREPLGGDVPCDLDSPGHARLGTQAEIGSQTWCHVPLRPVAAGFDFLLDHAGGELRQLQGGDEDLVPGFGLGT